MSCLKSMFNLIFYNSINIWIDVTNKCNSLIYLDWFWEWFLFKAINIFQYSHRYFSTATAFLQKLYYYSAAAIFAAGFFAVGFLAAGAAVQYLASTSPALQNDLII
jgi:hypothetical protein